MSEPGSLDQFQCGQPGPIKNLVFAELATASGFMLLEATHRRTAPLISIAPPPRAMLPPVPSHDDRADATEKPSMPTPSVRRRRLDFRSWDALLADADHLARHGYDRAGKWSLAQALDHVGAGLRVALTGSTNRMPWPMRMAARSFALPVMRTWRWIPAGIPAPKWWQPQVPFEADDTTALARFRTEVAAFRAHAGPYHPHPAFDRLDRESYDDLMLIHASHHLGFLVPRAEAGARDARGRG